MYIDVLPNPVTKIFFRPFGPKFGLKIREGEGGGEEDGPLPWIRHWVCASQGGTVNDRFSAKALIPFSQL